MSNTKGITASRAPKEVWLRIKRDYMAGLGSCRELAEKYSVSPYAVQNRCKREKWRTGIAKLEAKMTEQTTKLVAKRADNILELRERTIRQTCDDADLLRSLMIQAIPAMQEGNITELKKLAEVYKIYTDQPRKALGLGHSAGGTTTRLLVDTSFTPTPVRDLEAKTIDVEDPDPF